MFCSVLVSLTISPAVLLNTSLAYVPDDKKKEVWRWRIDLQGVPVEIYDLYKGSEKVGTGLRRIVERHNYYNPEREKKYQDLLKPEWESVVIARSKMVFARKKGDWRNPLYLVPCTRKGDSVQLQKPVQTPWIDIESNYTSYEIGGMTIEMLNRANSSGPLLGKRSFLNIDTKNDEIRKQLQLPYQATQVFSWDMLDDDFNIVFTMNNVRGYPRRYGNVWKVEYDTPSVAPMTLFLNEQGEPVCPEIPLLKEFNGGSAPVYAIPTSLEFKRFVPIMPDGRVKPEPLPTAGYYPSPALHEKPVFIGMTGCWTKEYITPEGPRYGWASLDLSKESGPIWKSVTWWEHGYHPVYPNERDILAQMNDGTWMVYQLTTSFASPDMPHRPYLSHSYPTKNEAIAEFIKVYQKEVAEPALAKRREEFKAYQAKYEEMKAYLGINDTMSSGGMNGSALHSALYETVTMLNSRLYNDFDKAWPKLGGDYKLKYMAVAYQLRRIDLSEESARQYAQQAVNPSVKATYESIANSIKSRDDADRKRKEDLEKARKMGWDNPAKFNQRAPASGSGFVSPFSNPYAQPSFAESSKRHEQYMDSMWKYLGGQSAWRPY